jgi:hypothetical protein
VGGFLFGLSVLCVNIILGIAPVVGHNKALQRMLQEFAS